MEWMIVALVFALFSCLVMHDNTKYLKDSVVWYKEENRRLEDHLLDILFSNMEENDDGNKKEDD